MVRCICEARRFHNKNIAYALLLMPLFNKGH